MTSWVKVGDEIFEKYIDLKFLFPQFVLSGGIYQKRFFYM